MSDGRYLVISADDFGRSSSINLAVATAFGRGLLTSASIVAGGEAFEEAAGLAVRSPRLSVGLHVTLSDGRPVLPRAAVPDLVDDDGCFARKPLRAGIAYWRLRRSVGDQIESEVRAQFDKAEAAGIHPTHVDCHHHLHIHPVLFEIIAREAAQRGAAWIRIPREPLPFLLRLHGPRFDGRAFAAWLVFRLLARGCLRIAGRYGLRVLDNVYGLSGTGRIDEEYLLALLPRVRGETNEIYVHPDMASVQGLAEMKAVSSRRVKDTLKALGFVLVGFRELSDRPAGLRLAAEGAAKT